MLPGLVGQVAFRGMEPFHGSNQRIILFELVWLRILHKCTKFFNWFWILLWKKSRLYLATFSTLLIRKVIIQGPPCRGRGFSPPPPNFEHHFSPPGSPLHSIVSILIWPQAYQSILLLKSWPILAPIHNHHPDCPISQIHSQQAEGQPKHIVTRVSTCTFFAPIYNHHLNFPKFQISTEMTYLASIYNHHPNRPIFQILTVLKYFSVSLQPPSKLVHFSN